MARLLNYREEIMINTPRSNHLQGDNIIKNRKVADTSGVLPSIRLMVHSPIIYYRFNSVRATASSNRQARRRGIVVERKQQPFEANILVTPKTLKNEFKSLRVDVNLLCKSRNQIEIVLNLYMLSLFWE